MFHCQTHSRSIYYHGGMTKLAAAALLLCAQAPAAPKARTIKELVDLALKTGADDEIAAENAKPLGMKDAVAATKNMWVEAEDAPDKRQHIFDVVLGDKPGSPVCATFSVKTTDETEDGVYLNGFWFRVSLSGELLGAMSFEGRSGELFRKTLILKDAKTRAAFEKEKDFWLKDSAGLKVTSQ